MSVNKGLKNILTGLSFTSLLVCSMQADSQNGDFRDDFIGEQKRPEWKIYDEDKNRYAFVDNEFLLLVTKKPSVNEFVYESENLPENYTITVNVKEAPANYDQGFSLFIKKDENNSLALYMHRGGLYDYVRFQKNLNGEVSEYEDRFSGIINNLLVLSITKKGVEYTGQYNFGELGWKEIGAHLFLNLSGKPGFSAVNFDEAPESPVKIDYFEIKAE